MKRLLIVLAVIFSLPVFGLLFIAVGLKLEWRQGAIYSVSGGMVQRAIFLERSTGFDLENRKIIRQL